MFGILFDKVQVIGKTETATIIIEKFKFEDNDIELQIAVPTYAYEVAKNRDSYNFGMLTTLADWCTFEMTKGAVNLYCLNANITPWEVKPKAGVTIPTYNFYVNYLYNDVLSRTVPGSVYDELVNKGGKFITLQENYSSRRLLKADVFPPIMKTEEEMEGVLSSTMDEETPVMYNDRFDLVKVKAKPGKYLKRVRLKSDVLFYNFRKFCPWDISNVDDEFDDIDPAAVPKRENRRLTQYMMSTVSGGRKVLKLEANVNDYGKFRIDEQAFSDILRWGDLVRGKFVPTRETLVYESKLCIITKDGGRKILDFKTITLDTLNRLCEKGVCYQLSARKFLFCTIDGYYYVEAVNA